MLPAQQAADLLGTLPRSTAAALLGALPDVKGGAVLNAMLTSASESSRTGGR